MVAIKRYPQNPKQMQPRPRKGTHALDHAQSKIGFTLIELSIVLVIIGLLVGGVLTGRDLIRAAEVRAQIVQIEGLNTAVNTFRVKYNAIPGDMDAGTAATFGFPPRGTIRGSGDGNGVIEGTPDDVAGDGRGNASGTGETVMFWVDLSISHLIAGGFDTASATLRPPDIAGTTIDQYLPVARIGRGNYIYVYSGGIWSGGWNSTGVNYYGLSAVTNIAATSLYGYLNSKPAITVQQAYSIDKKTDDGTPLTGNVLAQYLNSNILDADGSDIVNGQTPGTILGSPASCFDNGGVAGSPHHYSIGVNAGAGSNCALSFRFQ